MSRRLLSIRSGMHRGRRGVFALFITLAASGQAGSLSAQGARPAFDSLTVGVRLVANVNRNVFHSFWRPRAGIELSAETPFHLGVIETGVRYIAFNARDPRQPDFSSLYPFIGWGLEWTVARGLSGFGGGRVGSFLMFFESADANDTEQELAASLGARLAYRIAEGWSVDISGRYERVFTHKRLEYLFLAAGVSRTLAGPGWLKGLLE